jgi:hypothetical protein
MTNRTAEKSPLVYARVAGLAYIVTMMLGIFGVNFVETSLVVPGDDAATVNNILANETLFRIGIASELMMFVLVVLLSWALYVILRTVNRNLALLALLWRVGEAIIGGGTTVLSGLIPLLLIKGGAAHETEQLQALVGVFLDVRSAGLDFVLIFIGVGGTVFCYLFFKSRYIPRILAAWGILTYLTMLVVSLVSILMPDFPESTKMLFYAPGGIFEILLGFWLLIRGVNMKQWNKLALQSA